MKELETLTYNFSVQSIGFFKSLEKDDTKLSTIEAKNFAGKVSLKFMDALEAESNENFAILLRESLDNALKAQQFLSELKVINNEFLEKEHKKLLSSINEIINKLELIISKLIF